MNIKISKNAHSCAACGNDFQHEQALTSTVKVAEGVLNRQDYCHDCWNAEESKDAYSVWSMVYHDPKIENQEPPEVFSPLRQLFYEAAEEESRIEMAKAFLAAGLLRRQKVFRLIKESDESDGEVRITLYTDRIGNRLIEVPDPQFTYAEMDKARILLIERLQELEKAAAGTPDGEAPAESPAQPRGETSGAPEDEEADAEAMAPDESGDLFAAVESEGLEEEDEDEEDEFDDDDDDDDEFDEDEGDEDDGEEVEEDREDKEVSVMKSALAYSESAARLFPGNVAYANKEALHAQI